MYEAMQVGSRFIIVKNGDVIEKGFNYLAEAQERVDELNEVESWL